MKVRFSSLFVLFSDAQADYHKQMSVRLGRRQGSFPPEFQNQSFRIQSGLQCGKCRLNNFATTQNHTGKHVPGSGGNYFKTSSRKGFYLIIKLCDRCFHSPTLTLSQKGIALLYHKIMCTIRVLVSVLNSHHHNWELLFYFS